VLRQLEPPALCNPIVQKREAGSLSFFKLKDLPFVSEKMEALPKKWKERLCGLTEFR